MHFDLLALLSRDGLDKFSLDLLGGVNELGGEFVDGAFISVEHGLDGPIKDGGGSTSLGKKAPDEEGELDEVVERNVLGHHVSKVLNDAEESVHNPVCQPLSIVLGVVLGLEGLERSEDGVDETNKVTEGASSDSVEEEQGRKGAHAHKQKCRAKALLLHCLHQVILQQHVVHGSEELLALLL